jgi:hypothetical protein
MKHAKRINGYAEAFHARGFRSPSMYRNVDWFRDLNFSYDMSIPNVSRLDPQPGGCCTVMPYFLPGACSNFLDDGTGLLVVPRPERLLHIPMEAADG